MGGQPLPRIVEVKTSGPIPLASRNTAVSQDPKRISFAFRKRLERDFIARLKAPESEADLEDYYLCFFLNIDARRHRGGQLTFVCRGILTLSYLSVKVCILHS